MRTSISVLALAAAVTAQSTTSVTSFATAITSSAPSGSASATSSTNSTSGPATHTVDVGKGGHTFSPDVTQAEVGDVIQFNFYPTNHTVIRADYGYPCVPYEMILGAGHPGFWSGWEPVDTVLDNPPSWSVTVNDTDPIFFYCGAPGSCITYGMVGVINPNASTSLEKQRQLAEASTFVLVPGEDWPSEGSVPSGVATSSTSSAPTAPATTTATPTPEPSSHGLSAGAIAGIAIGGAAVLLAAGVAIWFCGFHARRRSGPAPGAPAQEVGYVAHSPHPQSMYGKPSHMSTVSGYTMPPNYDHSMSNTPVDPMMGQVHSGAPSPHFQPASPAMQQNMYAPGTHIIAPVEMEGGSSMAPVPRRSTEKSGVERYS